MDTTMLDAAEAATAGKIYYNMDKFKLYIWEYNQDGQDIPGTLVAFAISRYAAMDQIVSAYSDVMPASMKQGILDSWLEALDKRSYIYPYVGFNKLFGILLNDYPMVFENTPIGIYRNPGLMF